MHNVALFLATTKVKRFTSVTLCHRSLQIHPIFHIIVSFLSLPSLLVVSLQTALRSSSINVRNFRLLSVLAANQRSSKLLKADSNEKRY